MVTKVLNNYYVSVRQNDDNTFSWDLNYYAGKPPVKSSTDKYSNLTEAFQAGTHWLNQQYELGRLPFYEAT